MSTFNGKLLEYPFASIDRFDGENLASTIFFLSHCHKDHIEGLLAIDFIEVLRKRRTVKLYTSETTKNLMSCDDEMVHLLEFTIGLPIHQQQVLTVKDHQNKGQNLVVTLLSAGHCVGSVMFLIEGSGGKVLYTGDFRLGEKEISKIPTSFCNVKSVYVDTTFCCPLVPDFPTRVDTTEAIISIIKSWIEKGPNYMIHLKCKGRYGYEYIMKEVAKKFKTKLHVNEWRLKFSSKLPYMLEHFTTTSHHTQIHCCYYGRLSTSSAKALPCGMHFIDGRPCKVLTIVPSSLIFIQNGEIPKEGKIWNAKHHIWRVFHSMHASYNEMRILLRYLKPRNIYPFVPPADCQDVIVAYNRLQDLQCKENETMDDSTQTNLERSLPIEENTTWKQGLERAKPVKITSPPQMKNTSRLFSPPPARRKKKRSCASNLNQTNAGTVTSSKRLSLDESRSSKKMTSLQDSACDQVASLKTSSSVTVTRSANLDDRQSFSPSKGFQDNFTKTGKVNSLFKQRAEDVSFLSKSTIILGNERTGPSPKGKDKEEPGIVFVEEGRQIVEESRQIVEEGRQIVEETQDLVIPKLTNQQKILTNAEKRYYAPHEAPPIRNQVANKSKKKDFTTVPITFVENALEENRDKSHTLENPFCTIIERTSQIIEEDSQCGENESKSKTNSVKSVLRSSQIEDSENSYIKLSPNKCKTSSKISDFSDTTTTVQRSSQTEDSEFSVIDRKQTFGLLSQLTNQKSLDSNTMQKSSRIEEASENSFKYHSPKKINDDSQKTVRYLHNSPRRLIEEFSQVIEDFSEENFPQSTEDYSQCFDKNLQQNAITNTEITEDETNRIEPSNAGIKRRTGSLIKLPNSAGVTVVECDSESNSVNLKVGSSPTNNSNRTVQYSVIKKTGIFGKITELGHSVDENPSDDVAAERNVQNDDVINISSGDEEDIVSESEEDNDSTLSLIESDENSLDNSMELSQVF